MPRPITPLVAADAIIELTDRLERPIILIDRRYPPYGWAIPGGFMEVGESIEYTAIREAREEVSLTVQLVTLLGLYSNPARDFRGHVVTAVYVAQAQGEPCAADDASAVGIFNLDALPQPLAFDHEMVLADYRRWRENAVVAPLRLLDASGKQNN